MNTALILIDWIVFLPLALCVGYLLFFAVASRFRSHLIDEGRESYKQHRFLVLFPAYKEDRVITESVGNFLQQDYPGELYDVLVISDHMQPETNDALRRLGANVLEATYPDSSKAKAMALAMQETPAGEYDAVVIMDADNNTVPHFLTRINEVFSQGFTAIQAHRTSKRAATDIALLDAVSEEINNGFFRSGHNAVGLSAALSGSGMVIAEANFRRYVSQLKTAGEDKELEALILKEGCGPIVYIPELPVYDEKTQRQEAISNQRRRWIAAQFGALRAALPDFPKALVQGNRDYCDKILQWMLPPRLVQLAAVFGITVVVTVVSPVASVKWWILSLAQVAAMIVPVPRELMTGRLLKALMRVPVLALIMIGNLFKLKGANKKFIHTQHGE
ncbi:glycosyltransferase family 2 protein [Bacteroides sp.]